MGGIDFRPFLATICNGTKLGKQQKHARKMSFSFAQNVLYLPKRPENGLFFVSVLKKAEPLSILDVAAEEIPFIYGIAIFEQEFVFFLS